MNQTTVAFVSQSSLGFLFQRPDGERYTVPRPTTPEERAAVRSARQRGR